jgi:uncharacterized protein
MLHVLFYEPADDVASKAPAQFQARGDLLMVGTFGNPQEEGSMAIFSSRAAAEDFVGGDPFVLNGVVRAWRVLDWDEIYSGS